MKTTKLLYLIPTALGLSLAGAFADTACSPPIGFNKVTIKANSDSIVSSSFHQKPVFVGVLGADPTESGSGETYQGTVAPSGSLSWTADEFVETHYLIFTSGAREGHFFEIAGNTSSTLDLKLDGVELLDIGGDVNVDVKQGDSVALIPHWTLATMFPGGSGIPSSTTSAVNGEVFYTPNDSALGVNKAIAQGFFYFDEGGTTGWFDSTSFLPADSFVIPPLGYIVVRNNTDTDLTLCNDGRVSTYKHALRLRRASENDQFTTLQRPIPVTLGDSGLSDGFRESTAQAFGDELFVFDNDATGKNKPIANSYIYFEDGNWYETTGFTNVTQDSAHALQPGQGFIIRSKAGAMMTFLQLLLLISIHRVSNYA